MNRRTVGATALLVLQACAPVVQTTTSISPTSSTSTTTPTVPVIDAASGVGDRMFPELGNAGYDAVSYDIELAFDDRLERVTGRTTMVAESTDRLRSFTVDFVGHEVTSVTVDGDPAAWERGPRDMRVTPSRRIEPGAIFTLVTEYRGALASVDLTEFSFPTGWQQAETSRFLFSQPDGASGVFPSNDHPSDRADVRLVVRVPPPHSAVSGGRLPPEEGDDRSVHRFEISAVAPYLIPLAVGTFQSVTSVDGTTTWISAGAPLPSGFERQDEILEFLEEEIGPYPFASSGALIVDSDLPAALETQTLPTYTTLSAAWGEPVIAHELAHQWFGNHITLGQWDDIWLNEGFATYMTWRWVEHDRGPEAYTQEVQRAWQAVAGADLPPPDHPPGQDLFNLSVYLRGGLSLVALREFVGDERFGEFVREYVAAFSGEVVTTERFLTFVLIVLGPEAEDLMAVWTQDPDLPPNPLD